MHSDWSHYPDPEAWRLEAELWGDDNDSVDPDEQEFYDAFDALCNLTGRELETYFGDAIFADADTLEV